MFSCDSPKTSHSLFKYDVKVEPEFKRVHVSCSFKPLGKDTSFHMAYRWGASSGFPTFVQNVMAKDTFGKVLSVYKKGDVWTVQEGSTIFEYDVDISHKERFGGHYDSFLEQTHAFMNSKQIFIHPEDPISGINIEFILPPHWKSYVAWDKANHTFVLKSIHELVDCFIALGDYEEHRINIGGSEIHFALRPSDHRFKVASILGFLKDMAEQQAAIFGGLPGRLFIICNQRKAPGNSGSVSGRSMVLELDESTSDDDFEKGTGVAWTLAHEFFHFWNTGIGEGFYWISEGFTDYYAYLTLVKLGLMSQFSFLTELRKRYLTSTAIDATRRLSLSATKEMSIFDDQDISDLCYKKGSVVAAILDSEIRLRTRDSKSLNDFMRSLFNQFGRKAIAYGEKDIRSLLSEVAGDDMSPLYNELVTNCDPATFIERFSSLMSTLCTQLPLKGENLPESLWWRITGGRRKDSYVLLAGVYLDSANYTSWLSSGPVDIPFTLEGTRDFSIIQDEHIGHALLGLMGESNTGKQEIPLPPTGRCTMTRRKEEIVTHPSRKFRISGSEDTPHTFAYYKRCPPSLR